jgi:beta,beta-carotene 9',10'-dioxygenase
MNATRSLESLPPFRHSPEVHEAAPARIHGAIPDWLRGEVVRTCPTIFETPGWQAQHWFDGLGMIYAFRIGGGGIDFRSRLLDSETARYARQGESRLGTFGTRTGLPFFQRILTPVQRTSDNTNVNITRFGDQLVAMTEGDRQHVIDDATFASVGELAYSKDTLGGAIMTAHPQFDFERAKVVNVATTFGIQGVISIYEHSPTARTRDIVGSWKTKRVPYVHTFGLTSQNAILVAHPFSVSPVQMLWSSKGYIDHFDWRPEEGTRLVVIDRSSGQVREHLTESFFIFHTVNAFESGNTTVLDLLAYPNSDIVAALRTDRMINERPDLRPALMRVSLSPGVERARLEKLSDVGFEFPSTNYKRVSGRSYRFAYGASDGPHAHGAYPSAIVKADIQTGHTASFNEGSYIFGEPLFVARPGGEAEDDGVLLTVGAAQDTESSILAIIDARSMALLAKAEVPCSIPLGFHGSFSRPD